MVLDEYRRALPDLKPEDVVGSAYAIHRYEVDAYLGGPDGLAHCREQLAQRGMRLLLDYVPNHVAVDHPWLTARPECLIHAEATALAADPVTFFQGPRPGDVVAHGRDPYFPAWIDTAQINIFAPAARELSHSTLAAIAEQCDGVRCDMAMLLLNRIFATTWHGHVGPPPETEFWSEVIPATKAIHPNFIFIAEAYWETERELLALGFDYTYDKGFYDLLLAGKIEDARQTLNRPIDFQARMLHFIENHDETRAVIAFGPRRSLAAAAVSLLTPGAHLLHEGQLAGWRIKVPVQLGRRLEEASDLSIEPFYRMLLSEANQPIYHIGTFTLLNEVAPDGILAFCWTLGSDWRLVVVNYTDRSVDVSLVLPDALHPISPTSMHEIFSDANRTSGEERLSERALHLPLSAFDVQIWRPR
jgi:hypothetical protein